MEVCLVPNILPEAAHHRLQLVQTKVEALASSLHAQVLAHAQLATSLRDELAAHAEGDKRRAGELHEASRETLAMQEELVEQREKVVRSSRKRSLPACLHAHRACRYSSPPTQTSLEAKISQLRAENEALLQTLSEGPTSAKPTPYPPASHV